jgi:cytochrome P450
MTIEFDPLSPEFQRDPYPTYHKLRAEDPIWLFAKADTWIFTRHADVSAILRDPRFRTGDMGRNTDLLSVAERVPGVQLVLRAFRDMMLFQNPPDHTRLRGLVNKAFTPRRVEALRPRIQSIVDELLDACAARGEFDLIADLAVPLPVIVIAELLGVPPEDRDTLKDWSRRLAVMLDGTVRMGGIPDAGAAAGELVEYLVRIFALRRRDPRDDLISAMIAAQDRGDVLTDGEMLSNCVLILVAGHETTTNLIGNGTVALLEHPAELARLRDDPALARSAVEELLRFDAPVQLTSRYAQTPLEWDGRKLGVDQELNLLIGAANRDPAVFAHPDRLELARSENRHVAFGFGAHFCLGAPLARLESQIALAALARRFPDLAFGRAERVRRPGIVLRGYASVPLNGGC